MRNRYPISKGELRYFGSVELSLTRGCSRKLYSFESSEDDVEEAEDAFGDSEDVEMADIPQEEVEEPLFPHCEWDRDPLHYHNEENNPPDEKYWGTIHLPELPPFRGRVRLGRGGRVFIDRASVRVHSSHSSPPSPSLYY